MKVSISPAAFLLLAGLMLLLPLQWVVAVLMAVLIHECFHAVAVFLLGGRIHRIFIGATGAVLETTPLSNGRELLAALAGPIGSGLLLFLASHFPRLAICGAVHCAYNLIPLFPLDGGRVLRSLLFWLFPIHWAIRIYRLSQRSVTILLMGGCLFLVLKIGILPLLALVFLLRKQRMENPLANRPIFRYNRGSIDKGVQL